MSDSSKIICVSGSFENNEQLAADLISNLQTEGFIENELTDCTLKGLGYAKGSSASTALLYPEETEGLILNGVKVLLEPAAYYSGEVNPGVEVICPNCNQDWFKDMSVADFYTENLSKEQLQTYYDFVTPLYAYKGEYSLLKCPHCGAESEMNRYDYRGSVSFSNLAFEFYNWGDFKDEFIAKVEETLGHKVLIYSMSY